MPYTSFVPGKFVNLKRLMPVMTLVLILSGWLAAEPPEVFVKARSGALPSDMLLVVVRHEDNARPPVGRFGAQPLCFWRVASGTFLSFAGLEQRASGTRSLELEMWGADGAPASWDQEVVIEPRKFPVQRLRVAPRYVEFSQEDEDRAADDVDRLHDIYARRTPGDFISGNFRVPLKGRISAEFGMHRVFNNVPMSPHGGVDIAGRQGAMVAAAQGGIVALADDLFLTGNTVVLDHGCGLFTLYGHLSTILVPVGAVVRRGEILGLVGATGRATGPHLHWGARLGKLSLDPQSLTALNLEAWMRPEPDQ